MKYYKLYCGNPLKECSFNLLVKTDQPDLNLNCPICKGLDVISNLSYEKIKGENIRKIYEFKEIKRNLFIRRQK